ncbi:MAG: hypothetical protein HY006_03495 [Candidatus Sungbacteria bacterium]|nr:hypothetical protein [Candidatus Sungbacteria bacterium]
MFSLLACVFLGLIALAAIVSTFGGYGDSAGATMQNRMPVPRHLFFESLASKFVGIVFVSADEPELTADQVRQTASQLLKMMESAGSGNAALYLRSVFEGAQASGQLPLPPFDEDQGDFLEQAVRSVRDEIAQKPREAVLA